MCYLKTSDFYYGAFLSALMNTAEINLCLFERNKTDSRRTYRITTNKAEYTVFAKYVKPTVSRSGTTKHWVFQFSKREIERLIDVRQQSENVRLALICTSERLAESELALINYEQAMDAMGVKKGIRNPRIDVLAIAGRHGLQVYGSGMDVKKEGKDNTINISRNEMDLL